MAWVTKADRFEGHPVGNTHTELTFAPLPASHSKAPYFALAPRLGGDKETSNQYAPGAGAYDPPIPKKGHFDHGIPKRNAPFLSSGQRGGFIQDTPSPGPGAYDVRRGQKEEKFQSRTFGEAQSAHRQMLKSSSAPSIPQAHQSFGYEEAGGGRLVRQGPRDGTRNMTGRVGDSAGPGQYAVQEGLIKKRSPCGTFGAAGRDANGYEERPGPGHYDAKAPSGERPGIQRMMPSFASESTRNGDRKHAKSEPELPGPGQYSNERYRKPDLRARHPELQFFGSTTERFKKLAPGTTPGPGSYTGPPKRLAIAAKPFMVNSERFQENAASSSPGPGDYRVVGGELEPSGPMGTFSILGNSGGLAFGTMSRRFAILEKSQDPGPGMYQLPSAIQAETDGATSSSVAAEKGGGGGGRRDGASWRRPPLPSSAFHSQTPKDNMLKEVVREGQLKPPPGAYNPVHVKDTRPILRVRSEGEGFTSAEPRFSYEKKESAAMPGPGRYSPPMDISAGKRVGTFNRSIMEGPPQRGRVKGLGFESHTKRFKDKAGKSPGPGEYSTDPGWISKSFNVYFGDVF
mmetsp:Transcript_71649/g.171250  ORF Transcript_71649/g.171250 Transcript_71649/m.171250 type:complete len:571 (+) Transcript_71649:66-1778(+)